ncbi:MAG: class I SAM-dependent methyltransferase [Deltaproteobacteria bacterium]|nr:class I SAM-dependent methyltransferase [Deltaproteobacteria bacterium]
MEPAGLLLTYWRIFLQHSLPGPILDLACGECHNGIFLARKGFPVICCDISLKALECAQKIAAHFGVTLCPWQVDLEQMKVNPLPEDFYGGILVFRYLHRPLMPCLKKALKKGGFLIYETFTIDQPKYGKPHNPDFLLHPGELKSWFEDWEVIHSFEGIEDNPPRAVAQFVGRKPYS